MAFVIKNTLLLHQQCISYCSFKYKISGHNKALKILHGKTCMSILNQYVELTAGCLTGTVSVMTGGRKEWIHGLNTLLVNYLLIGFANTGVQPWKQLNIHIQDV